VRVSTLIVVSAIIFVAVIDYNGVSFARKVWASGPNSFALNAIHSLQGLNNELMWLRTHKTFLAYELPQQHRKLSKDWTVLLCKLRKHSVKPLYF
jgi:hypothetical protein